MIRTDNPLADFNANEWEKEKALAELPKCDLCERPIDDHYYNINGEIVCEECLEKNFKQAVEIW